MAAQLDHRGWTAAQNLAACVLCHQPAICAHPAASPATGPAPSIGSTITRTTSTAGRQHDHRSRSRSQAWPDTPPRPTARTLVKPRLTANRSRRVAQNDDYGAFARRILAAYARRVASGDVEALAQMTALAADLDPAIGPAVTGLRGLGYSWAEIGLRLGVTRQAAQQRWGQL